MTHSEMIIKLENEYKQLRDKAEAERDKRINEAVFKDPQLGVLLNQKAELALSSLRAALSGKGNPKEIAKHMEEEGIRLSNEVKARLSALGKNKTEFDIIYECAECNDTGYIPETFPAKRCVCFENKLRKLYYEDMGFSGLVNQTFESFDPNRIPNDVPVFTLGTRKMTQRDIACEVRDKCIKYVNEYPNNPKPNIVLMGESGLGKTFLLNSIAEKMLTKGIGIVRLTAYKLAEIMKAECFKDMNSLESPFDGIINAPVLFIDDLGTEPIYKNITVEYLFSLINERQNRRLHTIVATNLNRNDLMARYGERVASRLLNQEVTDFYTLLGKDLRVK